ncbi:MAG TPA: nucleoside-diphosphate kinase [Gaiellales bacterium]|jgi:nucleoside-diphosphate kinase|nr:nucleoside-diphosphate kinase [Gaiellales bacterium]
MADQQRTFVMIKPDAHARRLSGEILARFERRGFTIRGLKLLRVSRDQAAQHYAEHEGKPFYPDLVEFITSGPVVAMVLEGPSAVSTVRTMMGATNPLDSAPGTIRGDYALEIGENAVHGSDSPESAERELAIYFTEDELV